MDDDAQQQADQNGLSDGRLQPRKKQRQIGLSRRCRVRPHPRENDAKAEAGHDQHKREPVAEHPGAQTAYGIALRSGVGVAKNNDAALTQFRSAAGGGDREAMVQIATMSEGDEARRWLMRASELGYAPAMAHLSDFLMKRDPIEALSWLYAAVTLAADDASRKRAAALAAEMSAKEIAQAQKIGREYAREIRDRTQGR